MIAIDDTSQTRFWSHQDMMTMPSRIFWRYYGPIFRDKLKKAQEKGNPEIQKDSFEDVYRKWKERREQGIL